MAINYYDIGTNRDPLANAVVPKKEDKVLTPPKPPEIKPEAQPVSQAMAQAKTPEQILQEIANFKNQAQVNSLQQAIERTRQGFAQERQAIAPLANEQRRQASVQDTMNRQALANMRTQQGLSGSGAVGQDTVAQNVIQAGRMGAIDTQEAQTMADIERRAQSAEQDYQFAIANAKTTQDIEFAKMRYEAAKDAEAKLEAQKEQGFQRELATLGQYGQDYQAEINRRMAIDPNDPIIPFLQAERQKKIQGTESTDKQTYLDTIGRFANQPGGYAAEIQRVQATPTKDDDWAIPYLEQARAGKVSAQQQAEAEERTRLAKEQAALALKQAVPGKAPSTSTSSSNTAYNNAVKAWNAYLPLSAEQAKLLGMKAGDVKPKSSGGSSEEPSVEEMLNSLRG